MFPDNLNCIASELSGRGFSLNLRIVKCAYGVNEHTHVYRTVIKISPILVRDDDTQIVKTKLATSGINTCVTAVQNLKLHDNSTCHRSLSLKKTLPGRRIST